MKLNIKYLVINVTSIPLKQPIKPSRSLSVFLSLSNKFKQNINKGNFKIVRSIVVYF